MTGALFLAHSATAFPRFQVLAAWALRPRHASSGMNWTGPGGASGSVPWNIVVLLSLLTLLPALLVALTPFTRLLIVFHFLRQALGTQTAPSNQTLIGLALVLTYFLMQPVGAPSTRLRWCPSSAGRWMRSKRWRGARRRCGTSC